MNIKNYFNEEYLNQLYCLKLSTSNSKGIDKQNCVGFNKSIEFSIILRKVLAGTYKFSPYVEMLKLKGRNNLPRMISIPTLRDKLSLLVVKNILHETFSKCVNRELPNRYIREIKTYIEDSNVNSSFLKLDIEKFYDNIDHDILIGMLQKKNLDSRIITLIHKAILTPTVPLNSNKEIYSSFIPKKGVPQGLSISNILAQIYLSDVDNIFIKRKYFYKRYVDDIIIINHDTISTYREANVKKKLEELGLKLNETKTEKDLLSSGFNFLSYKISNNRISVSDKNIELLIQRIAGKFTWFKNGINDNDKRPQWLSDNDRFKEVFIEELNEKITGIISSSKNYGWLFYFSEINDEALLFKIDKIIAGFFKQLDAFDNKPPKSLKKLSRTFKVIKHRNNVNYICNFDKYNTIRTRRNYLIFRGKIDSESNYSDENINNLFERFKKQRIKTFKESVGYQHF